MGGQKEIEYLAELNLLKTSEAYRECDIYSIEEMKLNFAVGDKKFDATPISICIKFHAYHL